MRGQKALSTGREQCGTGNFLFMYTLLSGISLRRHHSVRGEGVRGVHT